MLAILVDDAIDIPRHGPQVPVLNRSKDVDGALKIIVRNQRHPRGAAGAHDVTQDFRPLPALAADGDILEVRQRRGGILRCLRYHAVGHTGLRIEPERRRGLETSTQRDQQVVGDVELGKAALHGLGAIHSQLNARLIEKLVNPEVDGARDGLELAQKICREGVIGFHIRAGQLNVDGSRQTEVENLAHDVRRLSEEREVGKPFGEFGANLS